MTFHIFHLLHSPFSAPVVCTLTPSARKRRVACLTFSRHREGIAKRPCINMIRRHATWLPRSATSYLAYTNFGEVFSVARYAVAYVPGSFRDFPAPRIGAVATERDPPVVFRGSGLHLGRRVEDNATTMRLTFGFSPVADARCRPPLFSSIYLFFPFSIFPRLKSASPIKATKAHSGETSRMIPHPAAQCKRKKARSSSARLASTHKSPPCRR